MWDFNSYKGEKSEYDYEDNWLTNYWKEIIKKLGEEELSKDDIHDWAWKHESEDKFTIMISMLGIEDVNIVAHESHIEITGENEFAGEKFSQKLRVSYPIPYSDVEEINHYIRAGVLQLILVKRKKENDIKITNLNKVKV